MRILVDGKEYDSNVTPIFVAFDKNEQELIEGMIAMASTPDDYTLEDREKFMEEGARRFGIPESEKPPIDFERGSKCGNWNELD